MGPGEAIGQIKSGQFIPLGLMAKERLTTLSEIPTLKELGHDISSGTWRGIAVPKGADEKIVEKLEDQSRYQTVYAEKGESVAAPTAGLHFTEELLKKIEDKGIIIAEVYLEVGLGTFRPVQVEDVLEHKMHTEKFEIPKKTCEIINKAKKDGRRIIAVGTTTVRSLESAVGENNQLIETIGDTSIFIYPGYTFKIVDALITNFHLPKSTLLMLVSAFTRREFMLEVYKDAVEKRYNFFSFGDAMFIY